MKVLVTGGAGYVGSHTCLELLRAGHEIHVVDNLDNGHQLALERVRKLSNCGLGFTLCDVRDITTLDMVFQNFQPNMVVHFAGLKAVAESFLEPLKYYDVNLGGTAAILDSMGRYGCESIVFSSSATVYGDPIYLPYDEAHSTNPVNPYGRSKLAAEFLLRDWSAAYDGRCAIALRYFNPVGADVSGEIGEDPKGIPNNLMPYISQVAVGRLDRLQIFGDDYKTIDGTGERDYIHVSDLAVAHVLAVEKYEALKPFEVLNIGCGIPVSVIQLVESFRFVSGVDVRVEIVDRRPGDLPTFWADASRSKDKLNWTAERSLNDMCATAWGWIKKNPTGFN